MKQSTFCHSEALAEESKKHRYTKGYKHTPLGILPQDWEVVRLGDIGIFLKGNGISKENLSNNGIPCIRYGELYTTYKEVINYVYCKTDIPIQSLVLSKKNDILIPTSGETAIDIATASCILLNGVAIGGDTNIIRTEQNGIYLAYCLNNMMKNRIASLAQGATVIHLYANHLKTLEIPLPPIKEQEKIAQILNTWDSCIQNLEKLIKTKERYKKGLMQRLLTPPQEDLTSGLPRSLTTFRNDGLALPLGGKHNEAIQNLDSKTLDCHDLQSKSRNDIQALRFKEFSGTWQEVKLGEVLEESSQRNKSLQIDNVLSVTNSMGFIQQKEYFEKEVASKNTSNYKIINYGEFAYNPARINVGSIALLDSYEIGILSPMYIVFKCVRVNKYFFKYWLDSFMFKSILGQFLAGSVRQVLAFSDMKQIKIYLPSLQEQEKIARVLSLCDEEIQTFKKMLESRKKQKRGLMQNLLNGKVRVKA
ncbi:restriction endonuclease subunit S [Helicobacter pullorum]|uniref:Restriction modification system DNA specificity domain-containing protein n=1 Tax=Helicobacter pullorum TaxID=35818 RepID=A0A377Q1C9_9HELI|nr:restriction endonuclease subunit S [Helicobacter pullorum]STQ88271.1 restriction modification system DNA specificity domain-containing protein [Helicobacter pullorum]